MRNRKITIYKELRMLIYNLFFIFVSQFSCFVIVAVAVAAAGAVCYCMHLLYIYM